jgi:hypothetical protein
MFVSDLLDDDSQWMLYFPAGTKLFALSVFLIISAALEQFHYVIRTQISGCLKDANDRPDVYPCLKSNVSKRTQVGATRHNKSFLLVPEWSI